MRKMTARASQAKRKVKRFKGIVLKMLLEPLGHVFDRRLTLARNQERIGRHAACALFLHHSLGVLSPRRFFKDNMCIGAT